MSMAIALIIALIIVSKFREVVVALTSERCTMICKEVSS